MRYDRASRVFSDRLAHSELYAQALRRHRSALSATTAEPDLPRRNVITFHGMGGIGKTELMRRLERWTEGVDPEARRLWGSSPLDGRRVFTSRFDLGEEVWGDVDRLLVYLRVTAAEAGLKPRAFDVGLVARWAVAQPHQSVPDFRPRAGTEIGELVKEEAKAALAELGVPLGAGWITNRVYQRLQSALAKKREKDTIAECAELPNVLHDIEEDRDSASAAELVRLLDWDIRKLPPPDRPCWVVFVDGFERASGQTEDVINRAAYRMPHLLWVIAGHRQLAWAQDGGLKYRGPRNWPGLVVAPGSDQHLVGNLAPEDADSFLQRITLAADGMALLPPDARERIVTASDGLPIYLDLSFQHAQRLLEEARPLTADEFGGPLPGLVRRVAAGLPADERRVLNAAALVRAFDAELLAAAAGADVDRAAVHRFLDRPMVSPTEDDRYQLHDIVRKTVRWTPASDAGGWAVEDWSAAGGRVLDLLAARRQRSESVDEQFRCALTGYDVAADLGVQVDWVLAALMEHPSRANMAAEIHGRVDAHKGEWTQSVERLTDCWLKGAQQGSLRERLEGVIASGELTDDVRLRAERHLAYRLRTLGEHEAAVRLFVGLRGEPNADDCVLQFQHGMTLVHLGRFREADELRLLLESEGDWTRAPRLGGEIDLHHGRITESADAAAARAVIAEKDRQFHYVMENRVAEVRRRALIDPGCLGLVEDVIALAKDNGAVDHLRSALCAKALCLAGDANSVEGILSERREWAPSVKDGRAELLAKAFDAAVREDRDAIGDIRARRMRRSTSTDERWLRPLLWWASFTLDEPPPTFPAVQWLEREDVVRERWLDVVRARRV